MTITSMLVSVAELSNILSILAVFFCFCAMILFITRNMMVLRVHGDEIVFPTTIHHMQARIPQMNMMKVHIPFTFKLLETTNSSYADMKCSVSSQVKYCIYAYWGVSIQELHVCLWKSWSILREAFYTGDFLKGSYKQFGVEIKKNPHADEMISLSLPAQQMDLGPPPRLYYPLVIFLVRNDKENDIHPDETVALINVVHIKDSVCTLPTSILAQYLKQANGQLSCLKVII
nr:cell growth regulator with RING finger domain protein 1-like [Onthophagus taurus]XP_022903584.1 cell growth regulator with RING finger domain protein 1-like [Onthophagus taurus]XP_022903585.1 cell growth regulator with RING finger domain protein 1-like [Onthophagus taurus]